MRIEPKSTFDLGDTVVCRLKDRIDLARTLGFQIRNEWLDGAESTWCEVGGTKILFIDLSQTAADQLSQVNDAIESCAGKSFRRAA